MKLWRTVQNASMSRTRASSSSPLDHRIDHHSYDLISLNSRELLVTIQQINHICTVPSPGTSPSPSAYSLLPPLNNPSNSLSNLGMRPNTPHHHALLHPLSQLSYLRRLPLVGRKLQLQQSTRFVINSVANPCQVRQIRVELLHPPLHLYAPLTTRRKSTTGRRKQNRNLADKDIQTQR